MPIPGEPVAAQDHGVCAGSEDRANRRFPAVGRCKVTQQVGLGMCRMVVVDVDALAGCVEQFEHGISEEVRDAEVGERRPSTAQRERLGGVPRHDQTADQHRVAATGTTARGQVPDPGRTGVEFKHFDDADPRSARAVQHDRVGARRQSGDERRFPWCVRAQPRRRFRKSRVACEAVVAVDQLSLAVEQPDAGICERTCDTKRRKAWPASAEIDISRS